MATIDYSSAVNSSPPASEAEVSWKLDEAGTWRAVVPLTDPRTATLKPGGIWAQYREGEGLVFVGIIEEMRQISPTDLEISGLTILGELTRFNTYLGRRYVNNPGNDIIDSLLSEAGWTREGSVPGNCSAYFEGTTYLDAIKRVIVELGQHHLREKVTHDPASSPSLNKIVEIGQFGNVVATIKNTVQPGFAGEAVTYPVAFAESLTVTQDQREFWTRFLPLGTGEGNVLLDVRYQDRLPNLLTNAGFENAANGWVASGTGTISIVTTKALDGRYSAHVVTASTYTLHQDATVTAGKEYRAEVWVNVSSGTATLTVEFLDASASVLQSFSSTSATVDTWEKLYIRETAPANAIAARVKLVATNGDVYFDSVRFWESAYSAGLYLEMETEVSRTDTDTPRLNYILEVATDKANWDPSSVKPTRVVKFKDVFPTAPTVSAVIDACNMLYDLTVTEARRTSQPTVTYELGEVVNLPRYIKPGDKIRLVWKGVVDTWDGKYQYIDVDQDLWIIEATRRMLPSGEDRWNLKVSTTDLPASSNDIEVVKEISVVVRTISASPQATISNWTVTHAIRAPLGPGVGEELTFNLRVPDNIVGLDRVKLYLEPKAIRATAKSAASGGATTTEAVTDHTHSITIGNHTHSITLSDHSHTIEIPNHQHQVLDTTALSGGGSTQSTISSTPHKHWIASISVRASADSLPYSRVLGFSNLAGTPYYLTVLEQNTLNPNMTDVLYTGDSQGNDAHSHIIDIPSHSHIVATTTTAVDGGTVTSSYSGGGVNTTTGSGGGTFTTSGGGGAHSHSIGPHTHNLDYGIFDGNVAQNLSIIIDGVDRTSELGGPWSTAIELDITPYLLSPLGLPVHGAHSVTIKTTQLGAVDIQSEWVAIAVPVGAV